MGCPTEYTLLGIRAFCSACFIHALTHMALSAARGSRGLHVSLIRMWHSWAICMTLFGTFDFSELRMFKWREQRLSRSDGSPIDSSDFFPWPDWFQDMARYLFGFDTLAIDFVTPTTLAECVSDTIFGTSSTVEKKYILLVLYHILYPVMVLLIMLIMDLILIWLVYPTLQHMELVHPRDPEEFKAWLFTTAQPILVQTMSSEEYGTTEEHQDLVVQFFREILAKCPLKSVAEVQLIMEHPRQGLAALSDLFQDDVKEEQPDILTAVDLGKAKMAMALLSQRRIVTDLANVLSTAENRKLYLWKTADSLDALTPEHLMDSYELWEALIHCAKHLTLEEWLSLLKSSHPLMEQLFRGGVDPARLRIAFVHPTFIITARQDYDMQPELSAKVWVSMRDALCELGAERIQEILEHQKPFDKLLDEVEKAIPGSGSFLIIGRHHESIHKHLHQIAPTRAPEIWTVLLDVMQFREESDRGVEAEDLPPKVRIRADELKAAFSAGVDRALLLIARKAGTGAGGYFLGKLNQARIRQSLENLPGLSTKSALSASEVPVRMLEILNFCRRTDYVEVEQLLLMETIAPLLEVSIRRGETHLDAERGAMQDMQKNQARPVAAGAGIVAATKFGGLSSSGLGSFEAERRNESVTVMVDRLRIEGKAMHYPVFGFFQERPSIKMFLADFTPLFWVALYTLWYETTRSLLLMMQCEKNIDDNKMFEWAQQSNQVCYEGNHLIVFLIACGGLLVWSLGALIVLGSLILARKIAMEHDPQVARNYSYFVFGYDIDYQHWDVLVKKTDNWITLVISFTGIVPDVRAKVFLCLVVAMTSMILHNVFGPFDDRRNMLCHRLENLGLLVRLMSFTLLELLIIFGEWLNLYSCTLVAFFTSFVYLYFNLYLWTNVLCELIVDMSYKEPEGEQVDPEKLQALRALSHRQQSPARAERVLNKCRCLFSVFVNPIVSVVTVTINRIAHAQQQLENEVIGFMPAPNFTRRLHTHMSRIDGTFSKIWRGCKILHFHKGNHTQRKYMADVLGKFIAHLLVELREDRLEFGNGLIGRFMTIAEAYKDIQKSHRVSGSLKPVDVAEIVKANLRHTAQATQDFVNSEAGSEEDTYASITMHASSESEYEVEDLQKHRLTGEDINDTLMFLQRLTSDQLLSLLSEAAKVNAEVARDSAVPLQPLNPKPSVKPLVRTKSDVPIVETRADVSHTSMFLKREKTGDLDTAVAIDEASEDPAPAWEKKAMELVNAPGAAWHSGKRAEVGANESVVAPSNQGGQPSAPPSQTQIVPPHLKAWV